ncbi:MAG: ATP-binding cassette domain-containing protein [Hadesarchaea archaeon]|nr:ATP-binding cassette domain-containing protein [Hadesarchaea archaeon]
MNAIKTNELTKKYDGLLAVDHVNLEIKEGELFGLLGPNGAGKTTLVHMLSTILPLTSGEAKVWGKDVQSEPDSVRSSIGIVFQDPSLDERLTGFENLDFHGRMYGMEKKVRRDRAEELLEMVDLRDWTDDLVKEYSGGMRRRLELARGFMHDPKILFLDEPTLGLDPQTRRKIWEYIQDLNESEGITIVLTTHYMEEADQLCNRIGIIDRGKIIALDKSRNLKNELEGDIITLELDNPEDFTEVFEEEELVEEVKVINETLQLRVRNGESSIPHLISIIQDHEEQVNSVGLRKPTLEDVFIQKTGRRIREEKAEGKDRARMMRKATRGRK